MGQLVTEHRFRGIASPHHDKTWKRKREPAEVKPPDDDNARGGPDHPRPQRKVGDHTQGNLTDNSVCKRQRTLRTVCRP